MKSRQFYTYKFKSARLKEFKYDINLTFNEALGYKEVISLFDNQILRSIRDITGVHIDNEEIERLHEDKKSLLRKKHSDENVTKITELQDKINNLLYIPEYITIVMDHPSHYKYLYENGLILNGRRYVRFNSSAGQARVSTVTFCDESIILKLNEVLDNGRNQEKELVPSKFNAYKGVYGSATSVVSTPRLALVPDYHSETTLNVNFVTETELPNDDIIEVKEHTEAFNRFDGQGLISYEMATKWASDLGLDYVPAQWCVRNSFCKGMLNTFPIYEFCETENNGNYSIKTSYKDSNGNNKVVDIRNVDVILSESMLKLWDSFPSIEAYEENCKTNKLNWGVSLHSPKKDKDIFKMNYQFLQTLNIDKQGIENISKKFVDWITGVTSKNVYYSMLFLLGSDVTEEKLIHFIKKGDKHWLRALILNPTLIEDKYIKKKIYDLVKNKIKKACLGNILIDGNFQTLVSDPYAMMEHVCGLEVKGILDKKEYYSNYWNKKGVKIVDSMRAPLTYRSEHLLLKLKNDKLTNHWYRYNYTGIIVNAHGAETMHWAGSDFDYDIIATTSDENVINGVYSAELPIVYDPPKSKPKKLTQYDLYQSDLFSFGSAIGSITNKSTTGYALLPQFDERSEQYKKTMNRIKMCTKLQSAQIDKAKIGRQVKGIPSTWTTYQKISDKDTELEKANKELLNATLLDKHPYFFTYLYSGTKNKYKNYVKRNNITCLQKFGMSIEQLKLLSSKTEEQDDFLRLFNHFSPVIDSECVMNNLCRYIESVDFGIKNIRNTDAEKSIENLLYSKDHTEFNEEIHRYINEELISYNKHINQMLSIQSNQKDKSGLEKLQNDINTEHELFKVKMLSVCSNEVELVNYLINIFYVTNQKTNKDLLWSVYGDQIFNNIKNRVNSFKIPVPDDNGEIEYLNDKYTLKEVLLLNV